MTNETDVNSTQDDWPLSLGQGWLLFISGMAIIAAAVSIDSLLPSFGAIATGLNVPADQVRQVIPFFFLGLGLGHIIWGPLSDAIGRRGPMIMGFSLYGLASIVCALAPSIEVLLLGRLLQGFGGAAGYLLGRALLRDVFTGQRLAWAMAMSSTAFALGPLIAPLIGWALLISFGWRSVMAATAIYTVVMVLVIWRILPETSTIRRPVSASGLCTGFMTVVRHPQSRWFMLIAIFASATLINTLSYLPDLFMEDLGVSPLNFSILFAASALAIMVGQQINSRLLKRINAASIALLGCFSLLGCALAFILGGIFELYSTAFYACLLCWFFISYLSIFTNSAALVMDPHGDIAGLTAALFGLATMVCAGVLSALGGLLIESSILGHGLQNFVLTGLSSALLLAWLWRKS